MSAYDLPLPDDWPKRIRSAMLSVVSLAHAAIIHTRGWAANSPIQRVRLSGELNRAKEEIMLQREEIRIKDARMRRIDPRNRPYYPPSERLAILELRAVRGWNNVQTARAFFLEPATISSWFRRIDDPGDRPLVRLPEPVNKFPAFVRYIVRRLKTLCPTLGKKRIAQILARVGLHLGVTTVARMLKAHTSGTPPVASGETSAISNPTHQVVTAKYPNHVWHVDLTVVPTAAGFWIPWLPFAKLQTWPFCWWVATVIDHFSRLAVGIIAFPKQPTARKIRKFMDEIMVKNGRPPKYVISDKGPQFWCDSFKKWCKQRAIRPRFGAIGKSGSIAVIERFFRSLKNECTRRILVPYQRQDMMAELVAYVAWYNEHRPHQKLRGATPNEIYHGFPPANTHPRFEPRPNWPFSSSAAGPPTVIIDADRGIRLELVVSQADGRRHLPLAELKKAA